MVSRNDRNIKNRYLNRYRGKPMTVCIAAICDVGTPNPKIVFCADRQISAGVQFEHGVPKIVPITPSCYVMVASEDSLRSFEIIGKIRTEVNNDTSKSTVQIMELIKRECDYFHNKYLERNVLFKYGLTFKDFISKSKTISEILLKNIKEEIEQYDRIYSWQYAMEFIVFGFDGISPHIYVVNEKGEHSQHDFLSFAVIGSGSDLAFPDLTKYMLHPSLPYTQVIVRVYAAKRIAERVQGVGKENTDLGVLHIKDGKGPFWWDASPEFKKILDDGIVKRRDTEIELINAEIQKLDTYFKESEEQQQKAQSKEIK